MNSDEAPSSRKRPLNVSDVKPGRKRGRPASGVTWVQLNINVRPDQLRSLDAIADREMRSRNEIVREAIDQYVSDSSANPKQPRKEPKHGD